MQRLLAYLLNLITMGFTVSIRETMEFGERIGRGEDITIPKECRPNSDIVYEVLVYANRMLPEFDLLTNEEKRLVSDIVAYLMRPDLLKRDVDGSANATPLYNDPDELGLEWELPDTNENLWKGSEYFRCFSGVMSWVPGIYDKLDPKDRSLAPAFKLADLCAYLIDSKELQNYEYTPEELVKFHQTVDREMEEV
jgi:hypothetical protein